MTKARSIPSASSSATASAANGGGASREPGVSPQPRRRLWGAMSRWSPASSGMTRRHSHQCWGQPWRSSTGSPAPASATCRRTPGSWTSRCSTPGAGGRGSGTGRAYIGGVPSIAPPASLSDGVVLLRPFVRRDVPAITRNCSDPEVPRWTRIPSPYTVAHADLFIDRMEMEAARGTAVAFAVCAVGEGEALGALTVLRIDWESLRGDLGYYLGADGRGRGLMTRAVQAVCPWVFAKLGLQRLQIHTDVDNVPSQRVAEAAGFVREGVLRSWQEQQGRRAGMVCYSRPPTHAGWAAPAAAPPAPTGRDIASCPIAASCSWALASRSGACLRRSRSARRRSSVRAGSTKRSQDGTMTLRARCSIPSATARPVSSSGYVLENGAGAFWRKPEATGWASAPRTMSVSIQEK